jgi:hypothetical protein
VVEDIVVGHKGVTLLPAVARDDLPVEPGDVVDLVLDEEREEVLLLALDPDRDPTLVRLRVDGTRIGPGFEVWLSQTQSHVVVKRPVSPGDSSAVSLAGAARARRT